VINAVRAGGDACASPAASRDLFRALLDLRAAEATTVTEAKTDAGGGVGGVGSAPPGDGSAPVPSTPADGALEELARACGFAERGALFAAHASSTLATLAAEEPGWDGDGPGPRAFAALVLGAPAEVIGSNLDGVVSILVGASNREREPALRLAALRIVDAAFENRRVAEAMAPAVETLLTRCVCENLVWRAGKTAAAVRYAAVVALGTMLSRDGDERAGADVGSSAGSGSGSRSLRNAALRAARDGELLASVASAMEEEYYADTRFAACHAMGRTLLVAGLALTDEQRRFVYPEILKRMDDSRDEIRVAAARVAGAFFRAAPKDYDETNVGYLLKGFVVHMDDANGDVQEAVCAACEIAAGVKTEATREAMLAARNTHRHPRFVDRVLAACDRATS
jgi:dynein assembly factor 5